MRDVLVGTIDENARLMGGAECCVRSSTDAWASNPSTSETRKSLRGSAGSGAAEVPPVRHLALR